MYVKNWILLAPLALTVSLTACGGGGGGGGGASGDGTDTTSPQISSTNPVDRAVDVDVVINPSVIFNEDILGISVTDTELTLTQGGANVAAMVAFDGVSNTVTLDPAASLALLTPYTASLSAGITDLSGNPLAASSWSFTTRDGRWQSPTLIEINNAGTASDPQIAFDSLGNALAVWTQSDGARNNIWANRFTLSAGWGVAEIIESENAGSARGQQIAIDSSGNAIAVWYQVDSNRDDIWANRFTPAAGWGVAELIETDNTSNATKPQIAIDNSGNALAVWRQSDGARNSIWANRFTLSSGWSVPELIETDNTANASDPQIAIDSSGNGLAVWIQSDGTQNVLANRFNPTTGWGVAEPIETTFGEASEPQIAIDSSGNALAVWTQSDGIVNSIWANHFTPTTGWAAAELVETTIGNAFQPQIAFDSSGNALAVWIQQNGIQNIMANRFTPTGGWGVVELIETDNTGFASSPQIAVDSNGNAVAAWTQSDGTRSNIWANRFTLSTGWGAAELIETDNTRDALAPQIAIDNSGNALAVWHQSDGSRNNIWANRFE